MVLPGRVVQRMQGRDLRERDGVAHRHAGENRLFFSYIDIDAVHRAIPVGREQRVAAVGGVDQQEVVARRREGEAQVHRLAPGPRLLVPDGPVQVVPAHAVEAVRGEGQGFPVFRQHREHLVARGQQVFAHQLGVRPFRPVGRGDVQVPGTGGVRGGEAEGLAAARRIGRDPVVGRVQRMRRQAPGLVFQGVEQEEILPGEALAGHDHRIGAEIGHVQGVLGPVHAVAEQPDGVFVRRPGRGPGVEVHRLLEPVLPVQAVALHEEGVRLRPEAESRREKYHEDGKTPSKHYDCSFLRAQN